MMVVREALKALPTHPQLLAAHATLLARCAGLGDATDGILLKVGGFSSGVSGGSRSISRPGSSSATATAPSKLSSRLSSGGGGYGSGCGPHYGLCLALVGISRNVEQHVWLYQWCLCEVVWEGAGKGASSMWRGWQPDSMVAPVALDLVLRLLHSWCSTGNADTAVAWLEELLSGSLDLRPPVDLVDLPLVDPRVIADSAELAYSARCALLRVVHSTPTEAAVLWLTAAHVAAAGRLPDAVLRRLGYRQVVFSLVAAQIKKRMTIPTIYAFCCQAIIVDVCMCTLCLYTDIDRHR
jgi:hypothetical protein